MRSYLDWISYAYSVGGSEVASTTMSPEQWVRVDAYIQYNVEKDQRIDQQLVSLVFREPSTEATRTLLPASESWEYRYVSLDRSRTLSPTLTAEYETSYTLKQTPSGAWLVDSVDVEPKGEVK